MGFSKITEIPFISSPRSSFTLPCIPLTALIFGLLFFAVHQFRRSQDSPIRKRFL